MNKKKYILLFVIFFMLIGFLTFKKYDIIQEINDNRNTNDNIKNTYTNLKPSKSESDEGGIY